MVYKVGIIGTGDFAHAHAQALNAMPDRVRIVGAASPDAAQGVAFCQKYDIPAHYTAANDLFAQAQPDIVHICTPPTTHAPLAKLSLAAGAHVLCEKPLCGSLAALDELEQVEQASGRTLSTIFQWRFGAAAQHYHKLITSGEFGDLRAVVCNTLWYRGDDYYAVPWRGNREQSLGGTIMGHGIHLIDLMLWLLPDWRDVYARLGTFDYPIEVDNLAAALIGFGNGAFGNIISSAVSPRQETYLRLDFQKATLEVRGLYQYDSDDWTLTPRDPADQGRWQVRETGRNEVGAQIRALLDSLDRGERPLVSGAEARRILDFMTALHKSAYTDRRVERGSIGTDDPFYGSMHGKAVES